MPGYELSSDEDEPPVQAYNPPEIENDHDDERREQAQVLYVIPVSSILGRLPLVPVGATGTIPFACKFAMRGESADFHRAFCDKSAKGGDGCRWWYVNSWALGWGTKQ